MSMQDTRQVIIMRHATALPQGPGERDFDRRLSSRGMQEARAIAQWLLQTHGTPEVIVSSPAARTRATAEAIAAACTVAAPPVEWDPALYLAEREVVLESLLGDPRQLLLVGHNPGLEEALLYLLDDEAAAHVVMAPAAVCVLTMPQGEAAAKPGMARLMAHMRPDLLPRGRTWAQPGE
jgi:phosphohistidine phosphatase SixA